MEWGHRRPSHDARVAYDFFGNVGVVEVGFIRIPLSQWPNVFPMDWLILTVCRVQMRLTRGRFIFERLLSRSVFSRHMASGALARWHAPAASLRFNPSLILGFLREMQIFVQRIDRDDAMIADLSAR